MERFGFNRKSCSLAVFKTGANRSAISPCASFILKLFNSTKIVYLYDKLTHFFIMKDQFNKGLLLTSLGLFGGGL